MLLAVAGLWDSHHLLKLHYEDPIHVNLLNRKFPFTKGWIKAPAVFEEVQPPVEYDPYKKTLDNTPKDGSTSTSASGAKESCDVSKIWTCSGVDASPYSECFGFGFCLGIPTSGIGFAGNVMILLLSILTLALCAGLARRAGQLLCLCVLFGFAMSAYLTYLEKFVINMFCPYCVASAVMMTVMLILTLIGVVGFAFGRNQRDAEQDSSKS
jgi:uncharacterized membrane protein